MDFKFFVRMTKIEVFENSKNCSKEQIEVFIKNLIN